MAPLLNVSMSGALVGAPEEAMRGRLKIGEPLTLEILDGRHEPIRVNAKLVRFTAQVDPPDCGVQFVDVDVKTTQSLEALILSTLCTRDPADG